MLSRLDPIIERLGKGYRPGPSAALSAALIVAMLLLLPWSPASVTSFDDGEAGAATNGPVLAVSTFPTLTPDPTPAPTSTASPIIGDLEAALESETDAQVRENLEDAIADLREG